MSERRFFQDEARKAATEAVRAIETETAAEVVVVLERASAPYREATYFAGFIASLVVLILLLFSPWSFPLASFPVDVALGFGLGAVVGSRVDAVKRALSSAADRKRAVAHAARAAFVDRGITRTSGRTGVLVYVSMVERRVEVVADVGVPVEAMGEAFTSAVARLSDAIARPDLDGFLAALRGLGPVLKQALPRAADDVNELPDEVGA
jgi:putative membrane protein